MSIQELGDRDGWRCHLCGVDVDPEIKGWNREAGTFDHLIPVSQGGDDSPENLRLAHYGCNSRRRDRQVTIDADEIVTIS